MLRSGRGSDLQCRSPATDNLQIGGHDAVQVSSVTLPNKINLIVHLRRIKHYYYMARLNEGVLHLLPTNGGHWDPGRLRHGALHGDGDVAGYFVRQGEMPLRRGWGNYTAGNRSLQSRLNETKRTTQELELTSHSSYQCADAVAVPCQVPR